MATSIQQQVTDIYDNLTTLNSQLLALCLNSRMTTLEDSLRTSMSTLVGDISNSELQVQNIQTDLATALIDLRAL